MHIRGKQARGFWTVFWNGFESVDCPWTVRGHSQKQAGGLWTASTTTATTTAIISIIIFVLREVARVPRLVTTSV